MSLTPITRTRFMADMDTLIAMVAGVACIYKLKWLLSIFFTETPINCFFCEQKRPKWEYHDSFAMFVHLGTEWEVCTKVAYGTFKMNY